MAAAILAMTVKRTGFDRSLGQAVAAARYGVRFGEDELELVCLE
jgi:hypothetical protein